MKMTEPKLLSECGTKLVVDDTEGERYEVEIDPGDFLVVRAGATNSLAAIASAWQTGALKLQKEVSLVDFSNPMTEQRIRDAAIVALGDLGNADALMVLKPAVAGLAKGAYPAGTNPETIDQDNRQYQSAMLSALRCGDENAAGPVVDFLMENTYVIARGRTWETSVPNYVTQARKHLPEAKLWQECLLAKLPSVPDPVLPALARRIAGEKDFRVTPIAFRVFGGRELTASVRFVLAASPVPAVAALAGGRAE